MSALDKQVGGNHYKNVEVQPVQIAYSIGATPLWLKVAKYLTREKNCKLEDLQKALHCVELEDEMLDIRCQKYIAEMVPFDHKDIESFAMQYGNGELVNTVLQKMYFGFYPQCKEALERQIEMYHQTNKEYEG